MGTLVADTCIYCGNEVYEHPEDPGPTVCEECWTGLLELAQEEGEDDGDY